MSTKTYATRRAGPLSLPSLSLLFLISLLGPWAGYVAPVHADADDIVFLKSGGRARGTVIESDPAKGTRIKLQDGTLRAFEAAAIDHIAYGGVAEPPPAAAPTRERSGQPSAPRQVAAPETQPTLMAAGPGYDALQGALRIESSEPGQVFIEGGEYGSTPLVIPNLAVGQHRVTIRFDAGDDDARMVSVRGGTETLVTFQATGSLRAFKAHQHWHFGLGLEAGVTMVDDDDGVPDLHVVLRGNYAVSRTFELHADARIGAFGAEVRSSDGYNREQTVKPGLLLGGDAQLNWGSVFTMSIGVDLGAVAGVGPVVGAHISPIGFRMGTERAVLLALQAGVMSGSEQAVSTFLLGVTYLFL